MEKIAVLGPEGTFSDCAVKKYLDVYDLDMGPVYYPTIDETFHSVGKNCRYGMIPIENTLDGYVQRTLDLMLEMDVQVIDEIIIPVQFSLVANAVSYTHLKGERNCYGSQRGGKRPAYVYWKYAAGAA